MFSVTYSNSIRSSKGWKILTWCLFMLCALSTGHAFGYHSGDTGVVERVKMILENEAHSIRNATDANGVKP